MRARLLSGMWVGAAGLALMGSPAQAQTVVFDHGLVGPAPSATAGEVLQPAQRFSTGALSFSGARWWGIYIGGAAPAMDNFVMRIFDATSGTPATTALHTVPLSVSRSIYGLQPDVLGFTHYQYDASFSAVNLPAGQYAISFQTTSPTSDDWYWSLRTVSGGQPTFDRPSPYTGGWSQNQYSTAFQLLEGTPAVPEPGSAVLIAPALLALAITRRRRPRS